MIDKKYMDRYAKLLLKFGVAFQKGQKLVLEIPAEAKELAESIQKEAAERGARIQRMRHFFCGIRLRLKQK